MIVLRIETDDDGTDVMAPKLSCDTCGKEIEHHDQGMYRYIPKRGEWKTGEAVAVSIVHKGACDRGTDPEHDYWWGELAALILFLKNYLGITEADFDRVAGIEGAFREP